MDDKQAVMVSIRPRWVGEIKAGRKEIEVRKTRPKQDPPFKCYIYETQGKTDTPWMDEDGHMIFKGRGAVVAEFICDRIFLFSTSQSLKDDCDISDEDMVRMSKLTMKQLMDYEYSAPPKEFTLYNIGLYGWHISKLKVYKKPYLLSDFCTGSSRFTFNSEGRTVYTGMTRAPQSWCYVDDADPLRKEVKAAKDSAAAELRRAKDAIERANAADAKAGELRRRVEELDAVAAEDVETAAKYQKAIVTACETMAGRLRG